MFWFKVVNDVLAGLLYRCGASVAPCPYFMIGVAHVNACYSLRFVCCPE